MDEPLRLGRGRLDLLALLGLRSAIPRSQGRVLDAGSVQPTVREEVASVAVVWMVKDKAERVLGKRRAFRELLRKPGVPPVDVDASELIYGELVANTVRYAGGNVVVRLELHGEKPVLVVRDHGPGLRVKPWAPHRDPYAESGRGLAIVERLARDLAVETPETGGTEIRAVLPAATAG